jgi:hypothetical protein
MRAGFAFVGSDVKKPVVFFSELVGGQESGVLTFREQEALAGQRVRKASSQFCITL